MNWSPSTNYYSHFSGIWTESIMWWNVHDLFIILSSSLVKSLVVVILWLILKQSTILKLSERNEGAASCRKDSHRLRKRLYNGWRDELCWLQRTRIWKCCEGKNIMLASYNCTETMSIQFQFLQWGDVQKLHLYVIHQILNQICLPTWY